MSIGLQGSPILGKKRRFARGGERERNKTSGGAKKQLNRIVECNPNARQILPKKKSSESFRTEKREDGQKLAAKEAHRTVPGKIIGGNSNLTKIRGGLQ